MSEAKFTILVPIYDEADNMERLSKTLYEYIQKASLPTKVLFINDGSKDDSLSLIKKACHSYDGLHFISLAENRGLSGAIKAGIQFTETQFVGYIDADLQTHPDDFELLIPHINDFELVTGIRTGRKDSFVKNFSSKFANGYRKLFTKDGITDTGCPLKIMHTINAKEIPMFKGMHRFIPALIQIQNGKVKQIPVRHFPRIAGEAKYHLWNRLVGPFFDCWIFLWMKKRFINYQIAEKG
ncbi:MAG: glycosyltransferase family 2 protein [Bacteroidota bacterium]